MEHLQKLFALRASLQAALSIIDQMIADAGTANSTQNTERPQIVHPLEVAYPLDLDPSFFKGKRPAGLVFSDGTRTNVPTWKSVVEVLLKRCNADPATHQKLMEMRGRIQGRNRVLLSSRPDGMRSPVKICPALFVETHYDTETLLRVVQTRIMAPVGWDCRGIQVLIETDERPDTRSL